MPPSKALQHVQIRFEDTMETHAMGKDKSSHPLGRGVGRCPGPKPWQVSCKFSFERNYHFIRGFYNLLHCLLAYSPFYFLVSTLKQIWLCKCDFFSPLAMCIVFFLCSETTDVSRTQQATFIYLIVHVIDPSVQKHFNSSCLVLSP